jgi:hypothetical protein
MNFVLLQLKTSFLNFQRQFINALYLNITAFLEIIFYFKSQLLNLIKIFLD